MFVLNLSTPSLYVNKCVWTGGYMPQYTIKLEYN